VIDRGRHNVVGVLVNAIDYEMAVERVVEAARTREPLSLSALAVHGVMTGVMDEEHRYRLNHLDLVVPDGQPVRWALNWLHGAQLADRVYGPNLMLHVCKRAAEESLPIYLYGSRPEVLEVLQENLLQLFPKLVIAGAQPSQFRQLSLDEKRAVVRKIVASGAMITFVGLGCPRQEVWVYEFRELLAMPLLAVGAAFDFHAGTLAQAPANLQRAGLEWLFRLGREPGRLWQRYVLLNPYYLFLLFLQWTRLKKFDPQTARPPSSELLYG
jgi:N-acetylglucosaminyldiphosphoundecaprenol N-acetyl-beta-D-mannosaminyltransferase